jgi:glucose/arabinose dehydrogenase
VFYVVTSNFSTLVEQTFMQLILTFEPMRCLLILLFILPMACVECDAQKAWSADSTTFEISTVATNLSIPWDLVNGPDGRLWFTEKQGWIKAVDPVSKKVDTIHLIPNVFVSTIENSGLHSMCFHPSWPDTMAVFCHYSFDSLASKLVRFDYDVQRDTFINSSDIFASIPGARSHNGSRLVVADDSTIYLALGDAYLFQVAQDLASLNGKILRFNPDGSCPKDNPFKSSYAYSLGHRNPQGLTLGRGGKLYNSEHGTSANDEVNLIQKGGNCGWPNVSGQCDLPIEMGFCDTVDVVEPLVTWSPTSAPSGLAFYDHQAIPEWRNCLLQAFLKDKSLCVMKLNEQGDSILQEQRYFTNLFYRIRDVEVASDGSVFVCSSNREVKKPKSHENDDKIYHIKAHQNAGKTQSVNTKVNGDQLQVTFSVPDQQATITLLTFFGGIVFEKEISTSTEKIELYWQGSEWDQYFLSIKLADGRHLIRQLHWQ